jgi:DNA invertase Pin-like site-specific DNA recombinase
MFDIYIRVSRLGERSEEAATEVYEAQCRAWAGRAGIAIDEVEEDTEVSGATAVSERRLERLIQKVEGGESEGILTPYLDRFGRDLIEGALAYRRLKLAGGRLVCVNDGIDSDRPGDEFQFQIRMVIAEDYLRRTRSNFKAAIDRAVEKGKYLASRPPFGYAKAEDGSLVVDETAAVLVVELYARRAEGANIGELTRWLQGEGIDITKSGVRAILKNRAYVGEMKVPSGRKGDPDVIMNHHAPILAGQQWEAAQIKHEFVPRTGLTQDARLRGLVYCTSCGKRCKLTLYGPPHDRKTTYTCTYEKCKAHAGMRAAKLDTYVGRLLMQAAADHEPHIEAIILDDTRYQDALAAVDAARQAYEEFRDSVELQRELGIDGFAKGLKVRKQALEVARRELAEIRPAARNGNGKSGRRMTFEEFIREYEHDRFARFIDKVWLKPAGRVGSRVPPVEERADVYFVGAEEPWTVPEGDPETKKLLESQVDPIPILIDLAAKGDQAAQEYLAATGRTPDDGVHGTPARPPTTA